MNHKKTAFIKKNCCLYVVKNALVWSHDQEPHKLDLLIKDGRLLQMKPEINPVGNVIDLAGKSLIPSGIDLQTHLRVPGQAEKETADTGLLAALKGGYSAILTMPNTSPVIDSVAVLREAKGQVQDFEAKYGITVLWTAAITKNLHSNEVTGFKDLIEAGVVAFTNDGLGVLEDHVMEQAFSQLQGTEIPLLQHAEYLGHGGVLAPGPVQMKLGVAPYPADPEWKMVERDIAMLRKYPRARYHVLHVSSQKTIEIVRKAKSEGLRVTAEVSPHHLFFNNETIQAQNLSFKMNPPIRSKEDQDCLWEALVDGTIDFVSTDHAPHEQARKSGSFEEAAFGTLGLETCLRVLIAGWKNGRLGNQRLVQVFSKNPAEFLNLPSGLGAFKAGSEFHGAVVDTDAPDTIISMADTSSLSKNSCFIGQKLPGKITGGFHGERIFEFT